MAYQRNGSNVRFFLVVIFLYLIKVTKNFLIISRCDAEPAALAKYVLALLRKDKPESELMEFCIEQLDVFLQTSMTLHSFLKYTDSIFLVA